MRKIYASFLPTLLIFLSFSSKQQAQSGCPGCVIFLPVHMPIDTLYLGEAPIGFATVAYDHDISFRLPKTTTPVAAVDSTTPPGFPISKFRIRDLSNLPAGLTWEANRTDFQTDVMTDGCLKICGTPTVTGLFAIEVRLTATVFGIDKDASFTFPISIYPAPDPNEPIVLLGKEGCGETTVTFINNIASNGDPRITYRWDFGNGDSSRLENPAPVTYVQPGTYFVRFEATLDTAAHTISSIWVTATTCDDFALPPLTNGRPDLYIAVENAARQEIYRSGIIQNAVLPARFDLNLPIGPGNYVLRVWDMDDGGLGGGDDFCGEIVFDRQRGGNHTVGNLSVQISMFHPVIRVTKTDTVHVFENPPVAVITPADIVVNCIDTLRLESSLTTHIEWLFEGNFFSDEAIIRPSGPGRYWVRYVDPMNGCQSTSEVAIVPEPVYPPTPFFINNNNWLVLSDTAQLPTDFHLQWYLNNQVLDDENGFQLCIIKSGNYTLELTDLSSGCAAIFDASIAWNPNYDCTVRADDHPLSENAVSIFPNPATDYIQLKWEGSQNRAHFAAIFDPTSRIVLQRTPIFGNEWIDVSGLSRGLYLLVLENDLGRWQGRFVKQ